MVSDIQKELIEAVENGPTLEAVSVMVASADPDMVARAAPLVAARLHPDMKFGEVLWQEQVRDGWSEAAVRVR